MKILILGGVAGGASCAARARRLSEKAEIILFERGPHVSFANCGLPYHIGGVIAEEADLLVASPQIFKERFQIEVRTESEVVSIDRNSKTIRVLDKCKAKDYAESYDYLVLAPGAAPIRPPLPGIDLPGIFALRNIPDARLIREHIETHKSRHAVIVGGGFIGLEMAENLSGLGLNISILEMQTQVLPPFDPEMVYSIREDLRSRGVQLYLGDALTGFEKEGEQMAVLSKNGLRLKADIVILSIGVKPEIKLAQEAGLAIGARGGIRVDAGMRTSDPSILAVGDVVEKKDFVSGEWALIPLAGPANRQGRIAAETITGRKTIFRGVQGTAVCKIFDMVAALTGAGEKNLKRAGTAYEKVYLHPNNHAEYYPGAKPMDLKVLFSPEDGKILGAQAVGGEGAEKRIDVIAMAIQMGATVYDLEQAELCYAPQFGSAKDAVNIAGMIAANALRGDAPVAHWDKVDISKEFVLDVREAEEFRGMAAPGAVNIPLKRLRAEIKALPAGKTIYVYCGVGQRAHNAVRLLRENGIDARNLSGGIRMWAAFQPL